MSRVLTVAKADKHPLTWVSGESLSLGRGLVSLQIPILLGELGSRLRNEPLRSVADKRTASWH